MSQFIDIEFEEKITPNRIVQSFLYGKTVCIADQYNKRIVIGKIKTVNIERTADGDEYKIIFIGENQPNIQIDSSTNINIIK